MRVVYTYDIEHLDSIRDIIKGYNYECIPALTTQINHIRKGGVAKIRVTINGAKSDVENLAVLLNQ